MKFTKLLRFVSTVVAVSAMAGAASGCAYFGIGNQSITKLTQKYADKTSKFVSVDNLIMHYRDEGSGPVVLMLHGEHSSLHVWDAWTDRLIRDFRVVRLDLPGHGLTGPDDATDTYDLEYMMGKVEAFMDRLGLDEVQMVGASYGGFITWNFALNHPERVERMILVDSTGYEQDLPSVLSYNTIPLVAGISSWTLPRGRVKNRMESMYANDDAITKENLVRTQELMLRKGNRSAFIDVARTMEDQLEDGNNESARIRYLETPTLVMWGESDEWTPTRIMRQFKVDLPNMQLVSYENVGHLPMEELPRQSARDAFYYLSNGELQALPGDQKQGM
ncbi:MAG: alpha/beta hydrolase [Oleibacter sp.]|nr:alpha/beta hydrolase [Thalassolituus sp.]